MRQYESYRCNKCGNIVEVQSVGGGELHCCGQAMEMTTENLQPGRNDCENTVLQMYPELKKVIRDMSVWGHPRMSGTGSTFFLAFDKKKNAKKAASDLECRYNVRLVSGVDRSGLLNRLTETY